MSRYATIPQTVFFRSAGRCVPKISWRVIDTTQGHNEWYYPRKTLASTESQGLAQQIADMLNGGNMPSWNADAMQAEINRLRTQLFEARDQRDEARADARNAWAELKKPSGGFWAGTGLTVYNENKEPELVTHIIDRLKKVTAERDAERATLHEVRNALAASHRQIADLTKPGTPIGWTTDDIANLQNRCFEAERQSATNVAKTTARLLAEVANGWFTIDHTRPGMAAALVNLLAAVAEADKK